MKKITKEYAMRVLADMNMTHDFMFAKVMEDMEICCQVLELLLHKDIGKITSVVTQDVIKLYLEGRGVRLDVYVESDASIYNAEMQNRNNYIQKRARYYQGMIDVNALPPGKSSNYHMLKDSYVIFICEFDPFGFGRHIYSFDNVCKELPGLELKDGAYKIFINTRGTASDVDNETIELLNYMTCSTDDMAYNSNSNLVKKINEKIRHIRTDESAGGELMTLLMRDEEKRNEGREEGIKEGMKEGRIEGKVQMAFELGMTVSEIAERVKLSEDKVIKILKEKEYNI